MTTTIEYAGITLENPAFIITPCAAAWGTFSILCHDDGLGEGGLSDGLEQIKRSIREKRDNPEDSDKQHYNAEEVCLFLLAVTKS